MTFIHVALKFPSSPASLTNHALRPAIMRRRKHVKPPFARSTTSARQHNFLSRIQTNCGSVFLLGIICFISAAVYVFQSQRVMSKLKSSTRHFSRVHSLSNPSTSFSAPPKHGMAPVFHARVVKQFDHDLNAFTQGLVCFGGQMYESTGMYGASSLRKVDVATGKLLDLHQLEPNDFGEGLAVVGKDGSLLMQALWKVGRGYVYDRNTLHRLFAFSFAGDAWGLATLPENRNQVYMSDGTSAIRVFHLDGSSFSLKRTFTVFDGPKKVGLLNELEFVGKELWANVWMSDFIARIDPEKGQVNSWIDLRGLLRESAVPKGHTIDVLNGIAFDDASSSVYVTGKYWPKLFSIDISGDYVADNITDVTNAFFLNPEQVEYVHKHVIV